MVDLLTVGETVLHLSPLSGDRLETTDALRVEAVGAESNTAIAARRVGTETAWLSKLPDTPLGRRVAAEVRRHGVDTDVVWVPEGRQGLAFSEHTGTLDGEHEYLDHEGSAVRTLAVEECSTDVVREATGLYTTGHTAVASPTLVETISALFDAATSAGTTTVAAVTDHRLWEREAARESIRDLLASADVFLTTESVARRIVGDETTTGNATARQAHTLASEGGFETVLISRGTRGATVWRDQTVFEHAAPETDADHKRGADDALFGVFLARVIDGKSIDDALAAGLAAAALTRSTQSAVAPLTAEDIQQVLDRQESERRSQ